MRFKHAILAGMRWIYASANVVSLLLQNPYIIAVEKFGMLILQFTIVWELLLHFDARCRLVFDSGF